ncbi:MAG: class I SAM-dependent methyltransferase [Candidatus Sulfotelmatobacter sp.]
MVGRSVLRSIYRSIPPSMVRFGYQTIAVARTLREEPLRQSVFGEKAYFVPPLYLMEDGARDYKEFKQNGLDAFQRFLSLGLKPSDRILDIGSGVGRKTLPLFDYITIGSYEGIDPIAKQVKWCTQRITSRYPNFRFQQIDVWSKHYNRAGKIKPSEYRFPFADAEFDFVVMGSVFTHMFPEDVDHYIGEISRVLKAGARGWITFFLLNDESLAAISAGRSTQRLIHQVEKDSRADNPNRLETAIGHSEQVVFRMFAQHGIRAEVAEYGSWCDRESDYYQDVIKITRT